MSNIAIRADNLSKQYRIGKHQATHKTLGEALLAAALAPFNRLYGAGRLPRNRIWALRDVSFEVRQGEVLGIIGRNGAGKSTLLKILSRITDPTHGRAEVRGTVGSLLEVGTGFHPELTGRENIYLNGAILGMTKSEIRGRFDEIVGFAQIEQFLDTPAKHYSSGMYMRLAFAVAAHLEPQILLVDEVLAVGDVAFQKKCLGKIGEVAKEGRTVLFVSHNLQAISQLTDRCLLLSEGRAVFDGPTNQALQEYRGCEVSGIRKLASYQAPDGIPHNHLAWATVRTSDYHGLHRWGEPITFEFGMEVTQPMDGLCFSFQVVNELQQRVCHFWMFDSEMLRAWKPRRFVLRCHVPKFRLYMGSFTITTWLTERRGDTIIESLKGICPFEVTMQGKHRQQYDWKPGDSVYLEDAAWEVIREAAAP